MCLKPIFVKGQLLPVPCGQCVECLMIRSTEWAFRIFNEASLYENNCFVTLTYNEANLPKGGHLVKRDLQLFIKRLRKKYDVKYFASGEYGSKGKRPHYHIIIFNWLPTDMFYHSTDKKGNKIYRSYELEKFWTLGFSSVGFLTLDSAKYCAKYLQKFNTLEGKPPPFTLQSRKPPIGVRAINENMINTDKVYANGKYIKLPRAYLNHIKKTNLDTYVRIKSFRKSSYLEDFGTPLSKEGKKISLLSSKEHINFTDFYFNQKTYEEYLEKRRKKFKRIFHKTIDND